MLSGAGHAKGDIPAALARERARHPGLTWKYGRPLGPHPVLLDLLAARVTEVTRDRHHPDPAEQDAARPGVGGQDVVRPGVGGQDAVQPGLDEQDAAWPGLGGPDAARLGLGGPGAARPGAVRPGAAGRNAVGPGLAGQDAASPDGVDRIALAGIDPVAVLVVGRGSTDPDANADVCKTARLLWEGRAFTFTETAFVSLARPSVTEGLERCRLLGARRIVVARYFLFPGVLPDRVAEQAEDYARAHPELEIRTADGLGDCPEIAALVAERYQEALTGDIRMNCDMCMYRTALPGFEHLVGAPQQPHDHPHDHVHSHAPGEHAHAATP
jgi:sirohydrochlorin ferrochelatase